ncbi:MAG: ferritin family protein [Betaproteobacteria bacterium]|nr:ferritin family protein [Betaproteobacteria bacterium]
MDTNNPIGSVADCYACALMIERESVARYREFAAHLEDHGNRGEAELFRRLARTEAERAQALAQEVAAGELPRLRPETWSWLDDAPPEAVSHELIFHLMTPHDALKIAIGAQRRAREFFEIVARDTSDPRIRTLALDMSRDEDEQIRAMETALAHAPRPFRFVEEDFLPGLMH